MGKHSKPEDVSQKDQKADTSTGASRKKSTDNYGKHDASKVEKK